MDYKQTELEHSNEFITITGEQFNTKDCVIELVTSSFLDHNLFKGVWKNVNIDTFEEMFIVNDIKLNSKL
jgi:hypothetical protein